MYVLCTSTSNQNGNLVTAKINKETIIKASNDNSNSYTLPLSNFDKLASGLLVCIVHIYSKPTKEDHNSILCAIKSSLSKTLTYFPPFSGQIITNHTGQTEILCNNKGLKLLEASANTSLPNLDLHNQNKSIYRIIKFPKNHREFTLNVQITSFLCGGFSISWIFDHALADANAFTKFLSVWCEIARTNKSSTTCTIDRSIFKPRSPPRFNQHLIEHNFTAFNTTDIFIPPRDHTIERHLYMVRGSTLERLKESSKKTRTVALSAYLLELMAKGLSDDHGSDTRCRMGWVVDGRKRMGEKLLDDYVGNVLLVSTEECCVGKLKEGSLEWVADVASEAIRKVAKGECFMDAVDWVESNSGKVIIPNIFMGDEMPSIVVSSCHEMPVMDMDFGFGLPEVGVITLLEQLTGYVNFISTGRGDGSWFVSASVTASLAKQLDSDPGRVFEPIRSLRPECQNDMCKSPCVPV